MNSFTPNNPNSTRNKLGKPSPSSLFTALRTGNGITTCLMRAVGLRLRRLPPSTFVLLLRGTKGGVYLLAVDGLKICDLDKTNTIKLLIIKDSTDKFQVFVFQVSAFPDWVFWAATIKISSFLKTPLLTSIPFSLDKANARERVIDSP